MDESNGIGHSLGCEATGDSRFSLSLIHVPALLLRCSIIAELSHFLTFQQLSPQLHNVYNIHSISSILRLAPNVAYFDKRNRITLGSMECVDQSLERFKNAIL